MQLSECDFRIPQDIYSLLKLFIFGVKCSKILIRLSKVVIAGRRPCEAGGMVPLAEVSVFHTKGA